MNSVGCDEFRSFVDPYLDDEFEPRERAMFDAHVAECESCREFLDQKTWLLREIKPLLKEPCPMPPAAKSRLQARLKGLERASGARGLMAKSWPAVTVAAAAFMLVMPLAGFNSSVVVDDLVKQHVQTTPVEVPTALQSEVDHWLAGKLPFRAATPKFKDQRVSLLGARLSRVHTGENDQNVPAAQLLYRVGPHKMSVLVFDGGESFELGDNAQIVRGQPVHVHDRSGHRVAIFKRGKLTYAVTSDLPTSDIVQVIGTSL